MLSDNKWPVYSVDDYFTDPQSGVYTFEFDKNHLAYAACLSQTRKALELKTEKVFVDNTFTLNWELEPYIKLSAEFECRLCVLTVENYHGQQNLHMISDEQIKKMAEKYKVKLY